MQWIAWPLIFALLSAGNNIAARIAMMAITTSSSISVKARPVFEWNFIAIGEYGLLLEPVKLRSARDGIGHIVMKITDAIADNDRGRRNGTPTYRRPERRSGFQVKTSDIPRPRQNNVRAGPLDVQRQSRH